MSNSPCPVLWNTIDRPFGLQDGYSFSDPSLVRRRLFEPSGLITQMSRPPARIEKKAIERRSGDQAGDQSATPGLFVRLRGVPPLAGTITMSPSSPRRGSARRLRRLAC